MKKLLVVNGPNINMLGKREASVYGSFTYEELNEKLRDSANQNGLELEIFQSNHEGEIVDKLQSAAGNFQMIIINAGAFTHTSIAIRDALLAVAIPFLEVHISNVYKREEFRKQSYLSDIADVVIVGFGMNSYLLAMEGVNDLLKRR